MLRAGDGGGISEIEMGDGLSDSDADDSRPPDSGEPSEKDGAALRASAHCSRAPRTTLYQRSSSDALRACR